MSRLALNEKATHFFFRIRNSTICSGGEWWRQQLACVSSRHPFATFNMVSLYTRAHKKNSVINFYYVIPDDDS